MSAVTHVKSITVADGTNTNIVLPSDWMSAHAQLATLAGNTAGVSTLSGTNFVFAGSNNVTVSGVQGANAATIGWNAPAGGAGGSLNVSAGTTSNNLTALTLADSNGVSFGLNGSVVTATVKTDYLTTAMLSNAATISNVRVSAGTTSNLLSAITFADSNGVSFGLNAGTMTAQHNALTSQSNQNVTAGNGGFAFQTLSFSNVNGVSFGTSAGSAITASVAAQTNQTGGIYITAQSTGQSSSSTYDVRTLSMVGDGIVSIGWSNSTLRISATQSNQAFSAGAASSTFQTLSFQDSNGLSFSNNAGAIRVSYTRNVVSNAIQQVSSATGSGTNTSRFAADDHVHAGVYGVGASNVGNTAGDTRVSFGRFVFAGSNALTISQATAANELNTIHIQGPLSATTISAVASANTIGTRGSRFALEDHQHEGVFSAGVSTGGNTSGDTRVGAGQFVFVGGANVTLSQGTAAGGLNTITISAGTAAAAPVNFSAGTTSSDIGSVVFSNSNGVSFGLNGSTITASVAAGAGGGIGAGVSTGGNTAGSTGTVTTGNVVFVGSNGITLSQSTGAAGSAATITISGPGAAETISKYWNGVPAAIAGTQGVNSTSIAIELNFPEHASFSYLRMPISFVTQSTTYATTGATLSASVQLLSTWNAVLYSQGTGASSRSLQSVASGSVGWTQMNSISVAANGTQYTVTQGFSAGAEGVGTTQTTQYSISNTNYSFTTNQIATLFSGNRYVDIPFAMSLTPGNYWLIWGLTTNTLTNSTGISLASQCNVRYGNWFGMTQANVAIGIMGSTNRTSGGLLHCGSFSTAGGGTTASLPLSAISSLTSNHVGYVRFIREA